MRRACIIPSNIWDEPPSDWKGDIWNWYAACERQDNETLADAYLAEHPADSDQRITEDVLRGLGWPVILNGYECQSRVLLCGFETSIIVRLIGDKWAVILKQPQIPGSLGDEDNESVAIPVPTIGTFCQLMRLLGIAALNLEQK